MWHRSFRHHLWVASKTLSSLRWLLLPVHKTPCPASNLSTLSRQRYNCRPQIRAWSCSSLTRLPIRPTVPISFSSFNCPICGGNFVIWAAQLCDLLGANTRHEYNLGKCIPAFAPNCRQQRRSTLCIVGRDKNCQRMLSSNCNNMTT